ncbi:unnamed protein product [Leuciscus chuanchicus]
MEPGTEAQGHIKLHIPSGLQIRGERYLSARSSPPLPICFQPSKAASSIATLYLIPERSGGSFNVAAPSSQRISVARTQEEMERGRELFIAPTPGNHQTEDARSCAEISTKPADMNPQQLFHCTENSCTIHGASRLI